MDVAVDVDAAAVTDCIFARSVRRAERRAAVQDGRITARCAGYSRMSPISTVMLQRLAVAVDHQRHLLADFGELDQADEVGVVFDA